ncbi:hypothetical protein PC119_g10327 [Phytophthora cactorum]|uniref:Uncharacterized protein n=1 Tax=Phytophthora cactorum TaxID=29920 RepID=A0A8T1CG39_9STRA|nr:hypothetical protein PC111_g23358 [Phytophthora cactorum]KAG2804794.1 hypothetical protein PC112_g18559 [Phytophthora cactorum]KAG2886707.1 hypothetical protein PC114_g19129 [Phytophthora cactorum]KAG2920248.1 hypothetical protein PC115_g9874 [Phytophthora cactorum]KAG2940148.1 hypothetical protein PC117_g10632 [Phytophthora cactorum]
MRSTGYTHDGTCEVWLNDTMVLDGDNCHEKFPAEGYTIDYSSCLHFAYWHGGGHGIDNDWMRKSEGPERVSWR